MSLFKCREWWNTKCGENENYNEQCMCIGKHKDTNGEPRDIIFVGSLEGFLRVYDPRPNTASIQFSDMLLETQLALPILAIQAGKFSYAEGLQLAVLHPRHLRVLKVNITEGSELHSYCTVDFMYEHELPAHAHSLCTGPQWLCVQLLSDGQLIFFENERFGMVCHIPILQVLPSPICYVSSSDSLILSDSAWSIYSYSYQTLANSSLEQQNDRMQGAGTRLLSEWELDLNEPAIDLQTSGPVIVALCERYIYCIKDIGQILWMRKLDYSPMCLSLHTTPEYPKSPTILVSTDACTVFVYKDNVVEWNSKLPFTPLILRTASFQGYYGMIVLTSEKGELSVNYLGTQQVQYDFCPTPMRAFNYEQGQKEIQRLELLIRTGKSTAASSEEDVADVSFQKDSGLVHEYLENNDMVAAVHYRIRLKVPKHPLKEARISFVSSPTIHSLPDEGVSIQLDRKGEAASEVKFYIPPNNSLAVDSLTIEAIPVILCAGGRSISYTLELPLTMGMKLTTPVREARFKITLSTNRAAVSVASLFKDLDPDESAASLLALEHLNGNVVTILVSKSTSKYRLQSDSLADLCLPFTQLIKRLQSHYAGENLSVGLDSPVPLHELWELVESHHTVQTTLANNLVKLGNATHQFEIVQRGFHTKILNAKSADEVPGIFAALQIAHDHVMTSIDAVQQLECELKSLSHELQSAIKFVISLMKLGASETKKNALFQLERALLPIENFDSEQTWEKDVVKRLRFLIQRWTSELPTKNDNIASSLAEKEFQITHFRKVFLQAFETTQKKL